MNFDQVVALCSALGLSSLVNFFVQRHFSKKDENTRKRIVAQNEAKERRDRERAEREEKREAEFRDLRGEVMVGLETIKLLSYARVAEEAERLLTKGFATPAERKYLQELHDNYKRHGWNGDMDERMRKVFAMRTDRPG
ncbi:MAG: hypothetical protein ACOX7N_08510 [Lawsonibacter sp.]|jgi:hypothetical protein